MSREIKFRVWDIPKKCWVELSENYENKDEYWGTSWQIFTELIEDYQQPETYVLMQYTGLKDKNGVEIYEGDIVLRYNDRGYPAHKPTIIEWRQTYHYTGFGLGRQKRIEVIGNIYENAELLEDTP